MARTYYMDFYRDDDDLKITVEYTISDYDPGNAYGPAEDCYPPEGGEVEIVNAFAGNDKIDLTDEEVEKWSAKIFEDHDFSADDYDY